MAAPPGNDPRAYSPSKLSELPDVYLTPSNDSLNNSGAYAPAILGPITASGHGPPARRDGQAYWNDAEPTPQPILISSTPSSPAAGRSPQDSLMGSPESEESTRPAILTTQIGPHTQLILEAALPTQAASDSQQLWDNVPSLPADLPPQPEMIEVRGRATPTANKTPRPRSRALSNASVWSHATVESNVSDAAEPSIANPPSSNNLTFKWHTLGAAIRAGLLPDLMDPNAISMSGYDPDGDEDDFLAEINQTLTAEIRQDVSAILQGWSTYRLLRPLELRKGHDLPTTTNEFHCMISTVLTAVDAGAATHDGETMVKGLTPQSWMRLTMAMLGAILRGALRSPSALRSGTRSLNGIDSFPLHADLDRPLTEGGAIMLMCQQLGGLYTTNRNHPNKTYPDSYFARLTTLLDSRMHQVPLSEVSARPMTPARPAPAPLTEADDAQVKAAIRERLILAGIETARLDASVMNEIREAVKAEIYANLNAEALENIEDWRAAYKHEFTEAMHAAFEAQYPGIHPNKGKAKAIPPVTHSQVVREAQPRIQAEVKAQVDARLTNIHTEIKDSLAANDPFWNEGPLREAIANDIRTKTYAQVQEELAEDIAALKTTAQDELDAYKYQVQHDQDVAHEALHAQAKQEYEQAKALFATNLEDDIQEFKTTINNNVKDGRRVKHSRKSGLPEVHTDPPRGQQSRYLRGTDPSPFPTTHPIRYPTEYSECPPRSERHPDADQNQESAHGGCRRLPPLDECLFLPSSPRPPSPIIERSVPLPPPTPMEEDLDYALEILTDRLHKSGPGIHASVHTPSSGTNHLSQVHTPSVPPPGNALDAQSEQDLAAPIPSRLISPIPRLEVPARAPPPPQPDPLAAILSAINATIQGLEARLTERLDVQDKRILALSVATAPKPPTPAKGRGTEERPAVAAARAPQNPPAPPAPPPRARETQAIMPRVDDPAQQEPVEEIRTPGVQATDPTPQVVQEAFQPPPDKHVRLNVDSQGKPTPATSMPPSWANVVTKTAASQHIHGAAQAKAVTSGTFRSNTGKARPETVSRHKLTGNTEATVIRHHGLEDIAFEMTIRKMTPASIINKTRAEVDRLTGGKVVLLSGRWSSNKNKNIHNFVYTFKGQIPFHTLYPLRDVLVKPLLTGHLVPNDGWTFAQIRNTVTSGLDGTVYSGTQLEDELRRNPAFENTIFCIAPHWQGTMHTVSSNPRGTVKFAYVDEDGKITAQAKHDGVFLFNERTRFVPTGDVATIILCGRCHRIGHATDSPACPLPANAPTAPTNMIRLATAAASSRASTAAATTTCTRHTAN
ncbi:hypothetical protein EDB86DRAFT_2832135 [Lactarius hatsudake]|nr:hypothetical protein EDB86DRAFT_2832135 [Lactarius hatsudake]